MRIYTFFKFFIITYICKESRRPFNWLTGPGRTHLGIHHIGPAKRQKYMPSLGPHSYIRFRLCEICATV